MICAMNAGSRQKTDRKRRTGILLVTPEPGEGGPVSIISFSAREQMRHRLFKADSIPLGATQTFSDLRPGRGMPPMHLQFCFASIRPALAGFVSIRGSPPLQNKILP